MDSTQEAGCVSSPLAVGELGWRQSSHVLQLHLWSTFRGHQDGLQRPGGVTKRGNVSPGALYFTSVITLPFHVKRLFLLATTGLLLSLNQTSLEFSGHYWQLHSHFIFLGLIKGSHPTTQSAYNHPGRLTASFLSLLSSCQTLKSKVVKADLSCFWFRLSFSNFRKMVKDYWNCAVVMFVPI